jgi:hypothetical protein
MQFEIVETSVGSISTATGEPVLPAIIAQAGDHAARRFIEFFTATIRNGNTRRANAKAVGDFLAWCEQHGLTLPDIEPVHGAAYSETVMGVGSKTCRDGRGVSKISDRHGFWGKASLLTRWTSGFPQTNQRISGRLRDVNPCNSLRNLPDRRSHRRTSR